MMENKEKETFKYTYSAKQQEEIKSIRNKYMNSGEDKMEQLRRLDKEVTKKATVVSLIFGIVGILILGFGMSLAMSELGNILMDSYMAVILGVIIGVIGIILVSCAYPIYTEIVKRQRKKIAPEIIRLSDELMK